MFILNSSDKEYERLVRVVRFVFVGLLVFGVIQYTGVLAFLDPLIQMLVPRGSANALVEMGRGVPLLSSEPSRAGQELIFFYIAYRFFFMKENRFTAQFT